MGEQKTPIVVTEHARGQLFSLSYAAKAAKIGRTTLWRAIKSGEVPGIEYLGWQDRKFLTLQQVEAIVLGFRYVRTHQMPRKYLKGYLEKHWNPKPEKPEKKKKRVWSFQKKKKKPKKKRKKKR